MRTTTAVGGKDLCFQIKEDRSAPRKQTTQTTNMGSWNKLGRGISRSSYSVNGNPEVACQRTVLLFRSCFSTSANRRVLQRTRCLFRRHSLNLSIMHGRDEALCLKEEYR
ncbi:hypothetical protein LENED_004173 [Lentinula edodes]|uniref:Uncharacterized protein n=1 Tax=Lentinula edodes TaxID=5353 RepID=A0A1Q3E5J7_LENED|nr:hypothetical protein LENED_004173 [Lentinula edodes]